jgi:hypothetical protein
MVVGRHGRGQAGSWVARRRRGRTRGAPCQLAARSFLPSGAGRGAGGGPQSGGAFVILLLAIYRGGYFSALGFSSIHHYSEHYFHYEHTSTYNRIHVAEALERLPRITEAFDRGKIGWSILMEIVSVASPQSEEEWLKKALAFRF